MIRFSIRHGRRTHAARNRLRMPRWLLLGSLACGLANCGGSTGDGSTESTRAESTAGAQETSAPSQPEQAEGEVGAESDAAKMCERALTCCHAFAQAARPANPDVDEVELCGEVEEISDPAAQAECPAILERLRGLYAAMAVSPVDPSCRAR